jgi:hypothetical protein
MKFLFYVFLLNIGVLPEIIFSYTGPIFISWAKNVKFASMTAHEYISEVVVIHKDETHITISWFNNYSESIMAVKRVNPDQTQIAMSYSMKELYKARSEIKSLLR